MMTKKIKTPPITRDVLKTKKSISKLAFLNMTRSQVSPVIHLIPDRFVPVQDVINIWFTVVVCSSQEMKDQREESEACPEANGVKGMGE